MSQTLPSNLFDPVNFLDYTIYKWYENTTLVSKLARANDPTSPITFNLNNAILSLGGQYIHAPVYKPNTTMVTRRDLTSTSDATPIGITTRDDIGVRVSRKIGPMSITKSASWMSGQTAGQLEAFFAAEASRRVSLDMRQFAVGIAKAAIGNMSGTPNSKNVYSASSRTNCTTQFLEQVKALLGDMVDVAFAPGSGASWVFRSECYQDLVTNQLNAGVQGIADRAAGGANALTLGLDYVMANDSALTVAGSPYSEYDTLLLGPGFMQMDLVRMEFTPVWMNPKAENVEFVLRGDYDLEFRIPGFAWDTSGGGANPTLATASTGSNWLNTYTDSREIYGCIGRSNASSN